MNDRYTKIVLTVIAGALVYLCIVMTAFPAVQAQSTPRAGEMINEPVRVIVGWNVNEPMPIVTPRPIQVQTERTAGIADRVIVVGWEENSARDKVMPMNAINSGRGISVPVRTIP
jgi:hypothetical protein